MRLCETADGIIDADERRAGAEWNPNYIGDHFHVEEYAGNASKVRGRVRLMPESYDALEAEIARHNAKVVGDPPRSKRRRK